MNFLLTCLPSSIIFSILYSVVLAQDCSFKDEGESFDLSGLQRTSDDYTLEITNLVDDNNMTETVLTYNLNICANTVNNYTCQDESPVQLVTNITTLEPTSTNSSSEITCASLGSVDGFSFNLIDPDVPDLGIILTYENGEECDTDPTHNFETQIVLNCSSNSGRGSPISAIRDECVHIIQFPTEHACPKKFKLSGGWIFVIVFTGVVTMYCLIGIIYNKVRVGTDGIETIPHVDFWRKLPIYVGNGCKYTFSLLRPGQRPSDYDSIGDTKRADLNYENLVRGRRDLLDMDSKTPKKDDLENDEDPEWHWAEGTSSMSTHTASD